MANTTVEQGKVEVVNRDVVRRLDGRIQEVLSEVVAPEVGMSVELGNASFTAEFVTYKVTFSVIDPSGNGMTPVAREFKQSARFYDLRPTDLWCKFTHRGDEYTVIGLLPKSRNSILAKSTKNGKNYKFRPANVKVMLALTRCGR